MNFAWKKLIVATALLTATYSASATTWPIKSWASGTKSTRLTQVLINAKDDDILELQDNLSVNSDIEIRKRLTLRSADNKRYTITNRGYTYGIKIHPGGTLIMENVIYDCAGMNQIEDVFLLNPQTVSGSTTNVSRMILNNGASIRNAVLSSSTRNENAVIHIKQGGVLTIKSGAEIINCKNNSNPGKGGAICCDFGTVIMTGGTIAGCYAKGAGGAIHTDGTRIDSTGNYGINARGDIYISGGYITNNTCGAGQYGGAIYLGNSGPLLHITGTTVISNNFSGTGENRISDDVSTYLLQNAYANRLKLVNHDESNPSGFSYEGIKFTGNVGVRYPDVSEMSDPQHTRFGAVWEYFTGTQEEPRQFFWNGNNEYRGRLDGNALVWSSHVTHELPKDGEIIKELIANGELSPLYIELNDDYEMQAAVNVPENYEIIIDLQGHNFICDFHVSNTTGRVVFRDSSVNKSGTVTGHRDSQYASAFYLEGGSYQVKPPPEWIAPNRVLIGNYCKDHPYMVAIKAWDADESYSVADLTKVTLEDADYEVRDVTFDKNGVPDIPKITFSAGDWKHMQHNNLNHRVMVLAAPAETNKTTGAFIECEPKIVLFDSSATTGTQHYGREGEFEYLAASRGLIKLIHITMKAQGETCITNSIDTAYLRFPAAEFRATQRKNGEKLHINIVDTLLAQLDFDRASGFTDNEVNTKLDTISD
ncbi:MAG: hypothetical protein J6R80_06435, partial [Kiritimatiellae bacterium]|nr:hypothetical protein [Kiritimatiellia bacterium]